MTYGQLHITMANVRIGLFWYISVKKYYIKQNYDTWTTTCNITMANVRTGNWYILVHQRQQVLYKTKL